MPEIKTSRITLSNRGDARGLSEPMRGEREKKTVTRNKRSAEPCAWTMTKNRCRLSFEAESFCTDFMKRLICFIPPSSYHEGGREMRPDLVTAPRARNFRLTRRMSSGVGGLACARFRALVIIVDATERDPRLPCWVLGGR